VQPPLYQGTILYPRRSAYGTVIFPLVQLKRLFQALYASLLKLMWRELLSGEVPTNENANALAILLFLLLCWLSFAFRTVSQGLLIAFFVFWFLDNLIAQRALKQGQYIHQVYLHQTPTGDLRWQWHPPGRSLGDPLRGAPLTMEFKPEQVRLIRVRRQEIRGGAFQDRLAKVWQAQLLLFDGSDWIVEEDQDLEQVRAAIAVLQGVLGEVPVCFERSYGSGRYALTLISPEERGFLLGSGTVVGRRQSPRQCHLFSRWQWRHSWALVRQIAGESGFLIFVMVMVGFMTQIGGIIEQVRRGFAGNTVYIEIPNSLGFTLPWQDWRLGLGILLAIAVMIYRGWQLSRVKHCTVDQHFLRGSLDNIPLGKLPTQTIEAVLAIDAKPPEILVLGQQGNVILPHFQNLDEALLYTHCLTQAIAQFKMNRFDSEGE
jgi:hypothetical protein